MPKRYVIIPNLALYLNKGAHHIAEELQKAITYDDLQLYHSWEKAKNPKKHVLKNRFSVSGIIEIEVEDEAQLKKTELRKFCEKILSLSSKEEKEKELSTLVKAILVKGFLLPCNQLSLQNREALQVAAFNFNPNDETKLLLNEPPLLYLSNIPRDIHFLLFIDHQFFLNFENWRQYNARESKGKGCVYDLFQGMALLGDFLTRYQKTKTVTFQEIKSLHGVLSESVYYNSTDDRRGVIRDDYNTFPLHADAVTVAGLKELLQRIKADNQADGFRIGYFNRSHIISDFCFTLSWLIRTEILQKKSSDKEESTPDLLIVLRELEKKVIDEIIQKKKDIPPSDIELIVKKFLEDFVPHEKVNKANFWANLSYYYGDLSHRFIKSSPKEEFHYDLFHSRAHALASAGGVESTTVNIHDYNDLELEALAKKIFQLIQEGKEIYLFTPKRDLAEKWADEAIAHFNNIIQKANGANEIIEVTDNLVHELEILHLFHDVNCRTNYLLMNFLFLAHSIKWAMEFNPNRLDAYSSKERIAQHKEAIFRTDYIIANQIQISKNNAVIDHAYRCARLGLQELDYADIDLSAMGADTQYQEISQPFTDALRAFEKSFNNTLTTKIKKYDAQPTQLSSNLFSVPKEYIEFAKALKQFQADYNVRHFFTTVATLSEIPEIEEDIKSLRVLTGFSEDSVKTMGMNFNNVG
ncbi:hypothetical protein [Legionella jamestowniensis]|uniref:Ankyrin repeat-containing protein n=1 Tax=Legionella jamestowniensis TaxID=455 RepID=A0A0W0UKN7_9GAMM|nr:hypothetical protein [Legionella jamestowniensis]KTD08467.1 hypothetical protein Ljam_2662 [Legionella jamestowniensis]OCH97067.1 hypothetical protein A8135_05395 [Legionella jamestowniensis]SFL51475.1 hypothetical protein SAMN02746073_0603 [Legionella jamestowniensis DSM 19215]